MKVKILITYKHNYKPLKSDVLEPIQTGRAISDLKFPFMLGDDEGDNISSKNDKYSELTAQYWAWKNYDKLGNPDYIGHMQYRRHFIFNPDAKFDQETPTRHLHGFSVRFISSVDENYIENIGLTNQRIVDTLSECDILVVKKADMTYIDCKNAREDFLKNVPGSQDVDYDLLIEELLKQHPDYENVVQEFNQGPYRYFYHMFVMKKEIFFEYNNFLFPILFALDGKIDYSNRGTRGGRVLGYLGEFLLSLFIMKKYEEKKFAIKELYSVCILQSEQNTLPIQINTSLSGISYAYYLNMHNIPETVVSILSLDSHIKSDRTEVLRLFYDSLNHDVLNYFQGLKLKNFQVILHNLTDYLEAIPLEFQCCNFFKIYSLLSEVESFVYLSGNCIFNSHVDFSPYFNSGNYVCKHCENSFIMNHIPEKRSLVENMIGLSNPYNYFTDKIVLIDHKLNSKKQTQDRLKGKFCTICRQEDILNYAFMENVNYFPDNFLFECSAIERKKYFSDSEYYRELINSYIIYFTQQKSPYDVIARQKFWSYLKNTPFLENNIKHDLRLLFVSNNRISFRLKMFYYALKRLLAKGDRRKKYKQKYYRTKTILDEAKHFQNSLF